MLDLALYQKYTTKMSDSRSIFRETPLRTPLNSRRPFINAFSVQETPIDDPRDRIFEQDGMKEEETGQIYGTTINVQRVMTKIEKFIMNFEETHLVDGESVSQKIYRSQLNQLDLMETTIFQVDGRHLKEFDMQMYLEFIYYPAEMIACFDLVIKDLYGKYFIQPQTDAETRRLRYCKKSQLMMGIKHLDKQQKCCVKDLGPHNIGRLVYFEGIVVRSSDIYPEMKRAHFICINCHDEVDVQLQNAKVQQPTQCRVCKRKQTYQIQHNLSVFTDKQYIKFQELPQFVAEGETPHALTVIVYDQNVDGFRPGDRVEIIGIYRAYAVLLDRIKSNYRSVFGTYIDLISFNVMEESKYRIESNRTIFSDYEKLQFARMAEKDTIISDLVSSFSPSIFGHQDIKKGILAQLFGGTPKSFGDKGRFRSDINICLLGDPSTAKSQLLQQVHKIASRSIYTSGRGSSAVGLTANVRKDPETHQFVLESGALVLSDQGLCCIDEFDKMDQGSRTILLEAMQQQTISIAKAGIVCQLNSRTAILCAANPVHSKYDPKKSVIQNINLPPALLSRFDLIYIMLDIPNEVSDKKLAIHILDFYMNADAGNRVKEGTFTLPLLAKYISYAREYFHPKISQKAGQKLVKEYMSMRALGVSRQTITATPRQLQSLIRISQAFAKMRLSMEVTEEDVEEAVSLVLLATLTAATNPQTGIIDLDIITTGRSSTTKRHIQEISNHIRVMLSANEAKYKKATPIDRFIEDYNRMNNNNKMQVSKDEFLEAFKKLQSQDYLALFGQNKSNPQFKLQVFGDS